MICDYRLKVFYTVAIKGSFTAAAKELGITQPAVSNHISELEGAIGDILFYRSRRESVLTHKGKILFDYAEKYSIYTAVQTGSWYRSGAMSAKPL